MAEVATEAVEDSPELTRALGEESETDRHKENEQTAAADAERQCDPFLDRFANMVNHKNIGAILADQEHMLETLEITNEKIGSLNDISQRNFQTMSAEFRQSTHTLMVMKKELDSIFRRIRSLKTILATQYPDDYAAAERQHVLQLEDEDDDT